MTVHNIGILGAGKLGITLAQLALKAGYDVSIAGTGDPNKIKLSVDILAPGAVARPMREAVREADVIILALPLSKFRTLGPEDLAGKLVIDAMNYWWEIDGPRSDTLPDDEASSEAVQRFLSRSRIVKAFNHMGYHDLFDETRPPGAPERKAIAIAGDDVADVATVAEIVDRFGFDPLEIGSLRNSSRLEAGWPAFGANLSREELQDLLR